MKVLFPPLADEIRRLYEKADSEFVVVTPWIKNGALQYILGQNRHVYYRVLTVGNLRDFLNGSSDIAAIEWLLQVGADIRLVDNLHAKVYIADHTTAIVTSANLTQSGLEENLEVGVLIDGEEETKDLLNIVEEWFSKARKIDADWLRCMQHVLTAQRVTIDELQQIERKLRQADDHLRGGKITFPKPKRKVVSTASRSIQKGDWARKVEEWGYIKFNAELAREFVRFFENAFQWLPEKTFKEAWFGIHSNRISLTVGNIWLASVWVGKPKRPARTPERTVWLLVDDLWDDLADSTQKYTPLGWKIRSWEQITELNRSVDVWKSYANAAEKIWASPIAGLVIPKNLANKQKVCDFILRSTFHRL